MWSRRTALFATFAASVSACGFSPVLIDNTLDGQIAFQIPVDGKSFALRNALEDQLGIATGPLLLSFEVTTSEESLAITADQVTTRFNLVGTVTYTLTNASGISLMTGQQRSFTGYSATGNTVSTRTAERDAEARLMVILACLIVDDLRLKTR